MKKKDKLNLGCGSDIREDYVNLDCFNGKGVDEVWNLNDFPYPFKDNSFKEILVFDIFEHLDYPQKFLEELHRIGKNGCLVKIHVPHFSGSKVSIDLDHKRGFMSDTFRFYQLNYKYKRLDKGKITLEEKKVKIEFPILHRAMGLEFLFNSSKSFQLFYEKYLSGIFPAHNVYFELEVIK